MAVIRLLDQATVNKIAAGEVVERPASVVKEMVENSIDAGASQITVEIREGGTTYIRISDDGCGIAKEEVRTAFLRHATSKIQKVEDLMENVTLGFRGEALASIGAVARVEMVTKTAGEETGIRFVIEGGVEKVCEEAACPVGTTIKVENLFFNTPPRKKFLKRPNAEAAAITDLMQKMILGNPEISFTYLNGKSEPTLYSKGSKKLKNSIFAVYGKEILDKLLPFETKVSLDEAGLHCMNVKGFISRPQLTRASRSYESFFINGRYVRSALLEKALDEAYKDLIVPGTFPVAVLHLEMDPSCLDVNVHPTKMEVRFMEEMKVRTGMYDALCAALREENLIARIGEFGENNDIEIRSKETEAVKENANVNSVTAPYISQDVSKNGRIVADRHDFFLPEKKPAPEFRGGAKGAKKVSDYRFEWKGLKNADKQTVSLEQEPGEKVELTPAWEASDSKKPGKETPSWNTKASERKEEQPNLWAIPQEVSKPLTGDQAELEAAVESAKKTVSVENKTAVSDEKLEEKPVHAVQSELRLVGQIFNTYWIAQQGDLFYLMDQHAAHERVLYDQYREMLSAGNIDTQILLSPQVCQVDPKAVAELDQYLPMLSKLGYEVEAFGEDAVIVRGVPFLFRGPLDPEDMARVIDMCYSGQMDTARDLLIDRIATMSCKAAVKGGENLSFEEAEELIRQLFTSANPYNCPHGRPTVISITKYELEKKFKRV